jgi:H+/Na+-translocating ferredoxin:NAD+ oxidoreductase subunit D
MELQVAPSPHFSNPAFTTRRMMLDVMIALVPVIVVSLIVFQWASLFQLVLCVVSSVTAETLFTKMRGRQLQLRDLSAVVTGLLLGLSLPATAPIHIGIIGSVVAIGVGKVVFGGLGYNLFNPAMVGRAFVMLSFAAQMGAPAYVLPAGSDSVDRVPAVLTQATPLTVAKKRAAEVAAGKADPDQVPDVVRSAAAIRPLLLGNVNGSVGETSALALLLGGLYLCIRRTASWEIPTGLLLATGCLAQLCYWGGLTPLGGIQHLLSGAALLGAFFIATDPVSSPITSKGKFLFGIGVGLLMMLIRVFSGYPEGLMFAVLLMNAVVPLINGWTIPTPLGGPLAEKSS